MASATSMVAGAALGAFFQHLLDTWGPPILKSLGLTFGVESEANMLKSSHSRTEALLTDADERQVKGELVRVLLSELKDAAYGAEDILDELECRALGSKIEAAQMQLQTRKRKLTVLFRVTHFFSRFSSNFELGSRIKKARESLDEILTENNRFLLEVIYSSRSVMLGMRPPTSSIVDESIVFGREAGTAKVVDLLTSDNSSASDSGSQVVSFCSMGGLRKTILARLIRNRVMKNQFDVSAWVYVSEDFDLTRLTKVIAEFVLPCSAPLLTSLDPIQVGIQNALKGKKFFLVLDDVRKVDCNRWDSLRAPLMDARRGSRIEVTTGRRGSHRVSSMMGTVPTHFLRILSDDDCWSFFKRSAFVDGDSDAQPDLVKIGKEIVNKCNGLPLAVKTLRGLLRSKVDVDEWKSILQSEIWDLPEEGNDILPALRVSYRHLPKHLKQCFAYCCIFPKGSIFCGEELVLQWMAQGFIQSKGSKDMEDIGDKYLADLVLRSLLYYVERSWYRMHDLIHDLARSVLGAEFLEVGDGKSHKNAEKVRHISCILPRFNVESFNFEYLYFFKSLRTLILQTDYFYCSSAHPALTIPPDLFVNIRHLRILNLKGNYMITELPESIGNLIQLRYLDLSGTMIERLPKSITRLYQLQTLDISYCSKLVEVPSDFSNLVNLRNIFSYGCSASIPFGDYKVSKTWSPSRWEERLDTGSTSGGT